SEPSQQRILTGGSGPSRPEMSSWSASATVGAPEESSRKRMRPPLRVGGTRACGVPRRQRSHDASVEVRDFTCCASVRDSVRSAGGGLVVNGELAQRGGAAAGERGAVHQAQRGGLERGEALQ